VSEEMNGFLVLDVVFEGQSLNYDQGIGNVQLLKKIHYNGETHTLVSRYALRYSLLETGQNLWKWNLADRNVWVEVGKVEDKKVLQPRSDLLCNLLDYVDLNLFGFLLTGESDKKEKNKKNENESENKKSEKGSISIARPAPVKISHAISLEPYKFDSHFNVNLGVAKRAGRLGDVQNIFQLEEHRSLYKYTVAVDLAALGKQEVYFNEDKNVPENCKQYLKKENGYYVLTLKSSEDQRKLLLQLLVTLFSLKRSIKGRLEDLSPKFMIASYYNYWYKSYFNYIELKTGKSRSTVIKKENDNTVIVEDLQSPHLILSIGNTISENSKIYMVPSIDTDIDLKQNQVYKNPKDLIYYLNNEITKLNENDINDIINKLI